MTYGVNTSITVTSSNTQPQYTFNTTTNTGSINWGTSNGYTIGNSSISQDLKSQTLHVKGNAEFEGDVTFEGDIAIKGKSIKESLLAIEERLAILHPNEELENRWDNLRELRKQYMELEAEIIEKEKIWAILKK
jgi:hypothetical protein